MSEQPFARVQRRIVDDGLQELPEDAAEPRAGLQSELDQLVAADGEIPEPVRARTLRLEHGREGVELGGGPSFRAQVCAAVRDEVEGELVAVEQEKPPSLARRARQVLG